MSVAGWDCNNENDKKRLVVLKDFPGLSRI